MIKSPNGPKLAHKVHGPNNVLFYNLKSGTFDNPITFDLLKSGQIRFWDPTLFMDLPCKDHEPFSCGSRANPDRRRTPCISCMQNLSKYWEFLLEIETRFFEMVAMPFPCNGPLLFCVNLLLFFNNFASLFIY